MDHCYSLDLNSLGFDYTQYYQRWVVLALVGTFQAKNRMFQLEMKSNSEYYGITNFHDKKKGFAKRHAAHTFMYVYYKINFGAYTLYTLHTNIPITFCSKLYSLKCTQCPKVYNAEMYAVSEGL